MLEYQRKSHLVFKSICKTLWIPWLSLLLTNYLSLTHKPDAASRLYCCRRLNLYNVSSFSVPTFRSNFCYHGVAFGFHSAMSSDKVVSVLFAGINWHDKFMSVKKGFYAPEVATIKWSDGTCIEGQIEHIGHGFARDIFAIKGYGYAFKMQQAIRDDQSNDVEYDLSKSVFADLMPAMYGCVRALHQDEYFSVLVCERLYCDFNYFAKSITSILPTERTLMLLFGFHAAFFNQVCYAAKELDICFGDLHWKNIALTTIDEDSTLLFLNVEACSVQPQMTVKNSRAT